MSMVVVVMGVSGSGKSTVGRALAARLSVPYAEGDEFHPEANVDKMASGHPLTDADRWPWLRSIAGWIGRQPQGGVVTCSALKHAYRELLRSAGGVWFLHLTGARGLLADRLTARSGHFMPASLLDSQLADLEPLQADEPGLEIDVALPVEEIVEAAFRAVARHHPES